MAVLLPLRLAQLRHHTTPVEGGIHPISSGRSYGSYQGQGHSSYGNGYSNYGNYGYASNRHARRDYRRDVRHARRDARRYNEHGYNH